MPQESTPIVPAEKFYVTTPIYYVNARPHIGHAYSTVVADVLARRHRLLGHETFFLTGTDEHGQKIARSAAAAGIPPQQFTDEVSKSFRDLWQRMGITNDAFIRTTDPHHKRGVQQLFTELYRNGHIYLSTYTGQYSVGEEMFVEGPPGTIGPDGRPTETLTEENFFFRLSAFQLPLLNLIESNTLKITPETVRNEVLSFLRGNPPSPSAPPNTVILSEAARAFASSAVEGPAVASDPPRTALGLPYQPGALKDLSISRSTFTWGIPVPEEVQRQAGATQPHIIYVWLDALANYITAVGYGDPTRQADLEKWWPADLHLVGKEITRFHCIFWPAFLLALNPASSVPAPPQNLVILSEAKDPRILPEAPPQPEEATTQAWTQKWLPKAVTANGWLLFDNAKMSKSKGNVVRTETILEAFGPLCPPVPTTQASLKGTASAVPSTPAGTSALAAEERPPTKAEQDLFAADILRYYLLREIPFGQDGTFSFDSMITRYNADLANGYGNLVSRTLTMINKYFDGLIPEPTETREMLADVATWPEEKSEGIEIDRAMAKGDLPSFALSFADIYAKKSDTDFSVLFEYVSSCMAAADGQLTSRKPWKLAADPTKRLELADLLYEVAEAIRLITSALYPILPTATARVWSQLGLGSIEESAVKGELDLRSPIFTLKPGTKLGPLSPIFPRADKSLANTMEAIEAATNNPVPPKEPTTMPTEDTSHQPADPNTHPAAPLKDQGLPQPWAEPEPSSFDPAAPPRTATTDLPSPGTTVAGSHAVTTERPGTPPHTEAQASGIFAAQPTQNIATHMSAQDTAQPDIPQIAIEDFTKIDLRVARILVAERIPKADKLLRLEVDLGYEQRQILSGIAEHYAPEELIGRKIVVIANLAPRKMRGLESRGMLLAASATEDGKPILATFAEDIPVGTRLR